MFSAPFLQHQAEFDQLAAVFLRGGANCVSLMDGETRLALLPTTSVLPGGPALIACSPHGLALQVYGLSGDHWQSLADTLLGMFTSLLNGEAELENLTAALVETQDRLVALYDLSKSTRRILKIPRLLELLTAEVCHLLDVSGAFAILALPGQSAIIRQSGQHPLPPSQIFAAFTVFRRAPELSTIKSSNTLPLALKNIKMISIPVREGVYAALGIYNATGKFTSPDTKLAKALAEQTGAQLENALLVQEDLARTQLETALNIARQVQMALLPQKLPDINGIDLYATSIPALQVGGDFFDLIVMPQHPLIFLLGDVTGKGMPAALLMAMTHTVARSAARNMPFTTPDELMKRLNRDLLEDYSTVGMFSTAFIGLLDAGNHRLTYCNAGQSPIIYLPAAAEPLMLEAQDIPLGIFEGYDYHSSCISVAPGDIFIVASDGFPESRDMNGDMFGYERLMNVISATRQLTAREMTESLLSTIHAFSGDRPQDDDQTLIIIKIL
jgi:sigma-B regulation protein RsbU (phosphoserine phosphatase)